VILTVNNSLVVEPLAEFGTEHQRDQWLAPLSSGRSIGAFALSEANAGSDAANQTTVARLDERGWVISGTKVWVANAEVADVAIVFAATDPGARARGISAFLVPLNQPGITRHATDSLGVRGLGCMNLDFHEVRVDSAALLGETGRGFRLAMRALEGGRIAIAAQALGVGQAALDQAVDYARRREVFGQSIANFQAIQFQLADLATEAAMAKLQASEAAHRAADRAMQILASEGYRRGSDVERLFRDVRAAEIYQGTSEVQRMIIAANVIA
jgi:butyryl-CoA dehydrogenase